MTEKIQAMTIILMTSILFTGGVVPYSFGTGDDSHGDDSHGDDSHAYECGCDKPSIFTVTYDGPAADKIEIFKKKNDFNNNVVAKTFTVDDNGNPITSGSPITIHSEDDLDKRKMSSNTFYKVSKSDGQEAKFVIHTSCSKPLFVGQVHDQKNSSDFEATLTVVGGYDLEWDDTMYADFSCDIRDQQEDDLFECDGTLINFDNNVETPHGTLLEQINLSTEFADNGVQLENPAMGSNPESTIAIYDSTPGSGADDDLEVNIGNLAIIPDNLGSPPNFEELSDSGNGGIQNYTFSPPKNIRSFVWVDQDGSGEIIHVTAFDSSGNVIEDLPTISPPVGNKKAERIIFTADNTSVLTFDYGGSSGGLTNICITEPEVPPTLKVTKMIDSESPETDPGLFNLFIDTTEVATNVGHNGMGGPIEMTVGEHSVSETAGDNTDLSDYTTTFGGSCNPDGSIILSGSQNAECTIINTPITPPMGTIIIKKALTNDNGGDALPDDFVVTLTEEFGDVPLDAVNFTNIDESMGVIMKTIPAGNYSLTEDVVPNPEGSSVSASYTTVLIAGDTSCPSMEDEFFVINDGDVITCTIYNDDNFVEGGEAGVFFVRNSFTFNKLGSAITGTGDVCTTPGTPDPCIEAVSATNYRIHDTRLVSDQTLLLFSLTADQDSVTPGSAVGCDVSALNFGAGTTFNFDVTCSIVFDGDFHFNYALVNANP